MTPHNGRSEQLSQQYAAVIHPSWRSRLAPLTIVAIGFLYLVYLFFYFDFANIGDRWRTDRAQIFALDSYAYKVHVETKWRDISKLKVALEGSRWETYKTLPSWIDQQADGSSIIDMGDFGVINLTKDRIEMNWAEPAKPIIIERKTDGTLKVLEGRPLPSWMRISKSKIDIRPDLFARVQITGNKVLIHRFFYGWEYFWFDFDSPLAGYSFGQTIDFIFDDQRLDPTRSNLAFVGHEIWTNSLWLHKDVYVALMQTIFMAVMGTVMAAVLGLPLAFMAAYNVTPFASVRFGLRRLFDALRGIDMLIWSLIFIRAFGMGPFSGLLAIGVTDTGTLGKLMSEAIENTDKKQIEGVQSTGADKMQQHRFGILPQILPLFISQTLYYLESNTRGAVIIGAMGAGGIGLQFLGALRTGTDWENVAYISIVVLITVMLMDMLSSRLRRALIK